MVGVGVGDWDNGWKEVIFCGVWRICGDLLSDFDGFEGWVEGFFEMLGWLSCGE